MLGENLFVYINGKRLSNFPQAVNQCQKIDLI